MRSVSVAKKFIHNISITTRNMSAAVESQVDLPIFDSSAQVKSSVLIATEVDSLVFVLYTHQ